MPTRSSYTIIMFELQVVPNDISIQCDALVIRLRRIGDQRSRSKNEAAAAKYEAGILLTAAYGQPKKSTKKGTAGSADFKSVICASDYHNQT